MDSEKFQKFCSVKRYATFHTNFLKLKNNHRKNSGEFRKILKIIIKNQKVLVKKYALPFWSTSKS